MDQGQSLCPLRGCAAAVSTPGPRPAMPSGATTRSAATCRARYFPEEFYRYMFRTVSSPAPKPKLRHRLGRWLSRREYVADAMKEQADLSAFDHKPSGPLVVGLVLIVLSLVVGGWPTIALLGVLAAWFGEPLLFVIGGPVAYGVSWGIWGLGMLISGKESMKYGKMFTRWGARKLTERLLRDAPEPP